MSNSKDKGKGKNENKVKSKDKGKNKVKSKDKELNDVLSKEKQDNTSDLQGFFATVAKYHYQTILFCVAIIIFIIILREANSRLLFPESRSLLNWFGFLVIANLMITYLIMITYRQVKNQQGLSGPSGYQGAFGDQGYSQNCGVCETDVRTMELPFEEPVIKQPVLDEKLDLKPRGDLIPAKEPPKITFSTGKIPVSSVVYMWQHSSFRGNKYSFEEGNYPTLDKSQNNRISSLIVPENYWTTLFQDSLYRGRAVTFFEGRHRYVGNYINDRVSSVKVYKKPIDNAVLFDGFNWRGRQLWISSKNNTLNNFNKKVKAIYVPNEYTLKVYDKINLTGRYKTFKSGTYTNITNLKWDSDPNIKLGTNIYSCILEKS
jgi:hypothetical protein